MRLLRIGLAYEAVSAAYVGLWAFLAPQSFHDDFPGLGMQWAAASGPFNEHYVRDVGAFYIGFAVLFAWAAARPAAGLVRAVAGAWVVVQVPHLVFHMAHDENLARGEWLAQLGSLASLIVVAVLLVVSAGGGWRARSR